MRTVGFDASEVGRCVHLSSGGVSVVLTSPGDGSPGLPSLRHWGAELGSLSPADARDLARAGIPVVASNCVDTPGRLALLPEPWTGWTGRPGLSGSRDGRDWSPRFTITGATLHGTRFEAYAESGPGVVRFEAGDKTLSLRLALTVELLPSGLLRSRAKLTNDGAPYRLDDLVIAYPVPGAAREILDLAGRWGKEKVPQRHAFTVGTHLREGRKGRTGADAAGVLHVGEPGFAFRRGEVWGVHTAFSGNHTHYAERVFTGDQLIGGGELLLPGEIVLPTGGSYASPWVYGAYGVGLDEVAARFHRHLRSRPRHVDAARPVTLNVWEAVYFDHDLDRLLDLAERAADLGVERYVLDDGWFGSRRDDHRGLGDWTVSPQAWPDGLHPLIDRVRELGMQFGLWFEPEMVNPDSDLARAHPEWLMSARGDELPVESRFQQVLDLAIPECWTHIRDAMVAILDEYEIGYLKWDHNRDLVEAGNRLDGGRPAVRAQTLAFYRLVDALKAHQPGLEIESCSSGGGRVDLEVMERCDRIWVSDCIDPLERQQMNRWTMQLLPPELLGSHIASGRSHTTGRIHDLSFRVGTAVLGHLGIEWDLARASEQELAELREWIDWYKDQRDHLLSGELVRADTEDDTLHLYGVVAPDRRRATYFLATLGRSEVSPRPRLRFPGLDPATRYRLAPLLLGTPPSGLQMPPWWTGDEPPPMTAGTPDHPYPGLRDDARRALTGAVFSGAALAAAGVQAPALHPDQIVLFTATAR